MSPHAGSFGVLVVLILADPGRMSARRCLTLQQLKNGKLPAHTIEAESSADPYRAAELELKKRLDEARLQEQ